MMPKIIHYCWFGDDPMGQNMLSYIDKWKEILPDYTFREWNNDDLKNVDNQYVKEAFLSKKWAFVSDYFRLFALYKYGGIYLDTDVEIKKNIDPLLKYDFFIGTEIYGKKKRHNLATAVIGAKKNNKIIKEMLDLYEKIHFIKKDKTLDLTANPARLLPILLQNGFDGHFNDTAPIFIKNNSVILPHNWLSTETSDSYFVHHFFGSWVEDLRYKDKFSFPWFNSSRIILRGYKKKNRNICVTCKENEKLLIELKKTETKSYCLIRKFNILRHLSRIHWLDVYKSKLFNKVDKYARTSNYSTFFVSLRIIFFSVKNLFKGTKVKRSTFNDNYCHILLIPGGGIGDHCHFLKYCYALKLKFANKIIIDVLLNKHDVYLCDDFYRSVNFINKVYCNKAPTHDLELSVVRFPQITYSDYNRLDILAYDDIINYVITIYGFYALHSDFVRSDYLGRCYSILMNRKREDQADINNILGMKEINNFYIKLEKNKKTDVLKKFGLQKDSYIILQSGPGIHFEDIPNETRQWPIEHYEKLVNLLKTKYKKVKIVQCGVSKHKFIDGVDINLQGKTTLSELFELISNAKLLISQEGGYPIIRHYFCRKTSCVLFGPTDKNFFGFDENLNISANSCHGCEWIDKQWYKRCLLSNSTADCMNSLQPEMVVERIEREGVLK